MEEEGEKNWGSGGLSPGKFFMTKPVDWWKMPFLVNNCK